MVTFSVVMPAYNAEKTLAASIESALAQTYRDFEIIVVDDGSKDRTAEIAEAFGPPVTCIRQENRGCGGARNTAIRASRGKYIAMLDADDLWLPNKLERLLQFIQEHPNAGLYFSDSEHTGTRPAHRQRHPTFLCGRIFEELFEANRLHISSVVVPRAIFDQVGLFSDDNKRLFGVEDWDLYLRIAHDYEIWGLHEPLIRHQNLSDSLSKNRDLMHATTLRMFEDIKNRFEKNPPCVTPEMYRRKLIDRHLKFARRLLRSRQPERARESLREVLALQPLHLRAIGMFLRSFF